MSLTETEIKQKLIKAHDKIKMQNIKILNIKIKAKSKY